MNLVLTHCWKEWRAQRGVLVAYTLLVLASLCFGFLLVPEHWWREDGRRALALSWFVVAGVIGVIAFVAPALVRGEFGAKDDQFVRRLPGALGVSFGGKLLFLALATAALPLIGLSCGELFLTAIEQPWNDLVVWEEALGRHSFEWPWPMVYCCYAMLLVPWVWAVGTWLPSGRMALGGTALFVLLLGLCVTAVLRQSPQIEQALHWQPWLWAIVPTGLFVAGVSWVKGRRGGGAPRSARFGLAAFAVGLLPPSVWLGSEWQRYHRPDPQQLAELRAWGITEDQRFVLATGNERTPWPGAWFRIDLHSGVAEQVGGVHQYFSREISLAHLFGGSRPGRHWRTFDWGGSSEEVNHRMLDLATGRWTAIESHLAADSSFFQVRVPEPLRTLVVEERRRTTPLRAPGGLAAWFEDDDLYVERADGTVIDVPWPVERDRPVGYWPAGHGFMWTDRKGSRQVFDLTSCMPGPSLDNAGSSFFVRGSLFVSPRTSPALLWVRRESDGTLSPCDGLRHAVVLGLLDDDHLLCAGRAGKGRPDLFLYGAADNSVREIPLPRSVSGRWLSIMAPMDQLGSVLPRDPAGRIWLRAGEADLDHRGNLRQVIVQLDTKTLATNATLPHTPFLTEPYHLLAWPDAHSALLKHGAQILRIDVETGERTVLFPRR